MEIVSEPDIRSPEEAREYLMKLHSILQYLGVCSGNMEEGSFRCDANVSIRPVGSTKFMSKVEVKNMNSFKAVYRALAYEVERQRKVLDEGGRLVQETRGWVEEKGATVSQRSKEYAHDYRYFPEPDLPPLTLSRQWVEDIRKQLPELSDARRERFMSQYNLSGYDVNVLTASKAMSDYFEACLKLLPQGAEVEKKAKVVANWLLGEFTRLLNAANIEIRDARVTPQHLVEMLALIEEGTLSTKMAKEVFEEMFRSGKSASQVVKEKRLVQISGASQLDDIIDKVLAENAAAVADFKKGKEQSLKFLVGQVMKATKGQANPQMVNELLKKKLNGK
jgi:aspartyl-tRNA(Asn)/glutamyl-tRNA(Gln) amidotransferase subunit B